MGFLTHAEIGKLKTYKFQAGVYSPLDNALAPMYTTISRCIPTWISPNMLTVMGLFSATLGTACVCYAPLNPAALVFCAVSYHLYLLFDAVDGKHARSTGQDSPLGALLDHGCDCFTAYMISLAAALSVDPHFNTPIVFLTTAYISHIIFFMAMWQYYEMHILEHLGTTEIIFGASALLCLNAAVGTEYADGNLVDVIPSVGSTRSPLTGRPITIQEGVNNIFIAFAVVIFVFRNVFICVTRTGRLSVLLGLLPAFVYVVFSASLMGSGFVEIAPLKMSFLLAGPFFEMGLKMLLCAMTGRRPPFWYWTIVPVAVFAVYTRTYGKQVWLLNAVLIFEAGKLFHFIASILREMCVVLDTPLLATVPPKKQK